MERTPHVLIAGEGAWALAAANGLPEVRDPDTYYRITSYNVCYTKLLRCPPY